MCPVPSLQQLHEALFQAAWSEGGRMGRAERWNFPEPEAFDLPQGKLLEVKVGGLAW